MYVQWFQYTCVIVIKSLSAVEVHSLAAVDTAYDDPHKYPPWAEKSDDAVQTVVGRIIPNNCGSVDRLGTKQCSGGK